MGRLSKSRHRKREEREISNRLVCRFVCSQLLSCTSILLVVCQSGKSPCKTTQSAVPKSYLRKNCGDQLNLCLLWKIRPVNKRQERERMINQQRHWQMQAHGASAVCIIIATNWTSKFTLIQTSTFGSSCRFCLFNILMPAKSIRSHFK